MGARGGDGVGDAGDCEVFVASILVTWGGSGVDLWRAYLKVFSELSDLAGF